MKEFSVNVSDKSKSNIFIENGLLASAGKIIKDNFNSKKIALVSDTNVYPLYGDRIKTQLEYEGFEGHIYLSCRGSFEKHNAACKNC